MWYAYVFNLGRDLVRNIIVCPIMTSWYGNISALLTLCEGICRWQLNSAHKGPVTRGFGVFLYVRLNKRLNSQWICRWFYPPWLSCNITVMLSAFPGAVHASSVHGVDNSKSYLYGRRQCGQDPIIWHPCFRLRIVYSDSNPARGQVSRFDKTNDELRNAEVLISNRNNGA